MQITVSPPPAAKPRARNTHDLSNLYAPVLGLALRLRTRNIELSEKVRPRVEADLKTLEAKAAAHGCTPAQINEMQFALVAYFDETVLSLADSDLRRAWAMNPLQIRFTEHNWAGEEFFRHLDDLLEDTETNTDVIEVYYHCLLLGFTGIYKISFKENKDEDRSELREVIERVAAALRSAGRLAPRALSGRWRAKDQPPAPRPEALPTWAKISIAALLALAFFGYLILYKMLPEVTVKL